MKFLTFSAAAALAGLVMTALPSQALPPVGLSETAPAAHHAIHYRPYKKLRPWTEQVEDRYCRRRSERICHKVYPQRERESHTHYLQRNYCASLLYDECTLSRQIGSLGSYSRH
ncbi:MAG: hypothetical protein AAGF81_06035 [Pseudomonadota bacterium]